jgi:Tfp pilus assembly protein PilE
VPVRKAFTLVEAIVVFVILATLAGLRAPAFMAAREAANRRSGEPPQPPKTWLLETVRHDEHLWVISSAAPTVPAMFAHHPDCPCSGKVER